MNKSGKIALLTKIVQNRLTQKELSQLRKSREPIYLTMNLGDGEDTTETNDPTYHIDIYDNWKHCHCYWQYADGRIEEKELVDLRKQ